MRPKRRKDMEELEAVLREIPQSGIPSDVLGSYTGMDADESWPVQDVDDL